MEDAGLSTGEIFMQTGSEPCMQLQYMIDITNNFNEEGILGRGGFGVVYKGLHNGEMVAVKKLLQEIPSSQKQFVNEVNFLMKLKHPNIVRLVGYCYETRSLMHQERNSAFVWDTLGLLCLEYVPNGSLKEYISDASSGLNWHRRWKIIEGISFGLKYLHEYSNEPIIHLDLKPANILLDANMLPKIADFGLSRLFDQNKTIHTAKVTGTYGYMPREAIDKGIITPKSDIFSLGVIIMEVITGHRDYPDITKPSKHFLNDELKKWTHRLRKEPGYKSLEPDCQQIERCLRVGLICVDEDRTKRPTMKKIIDMLQGLESMDKYIGNEEMAKALYDKKGLRIEGYTGASTFHNMDRVDLMEISDVSHTPLPDLKKLNSLRSIHFVRCSDMVFAELNGTVVLHSVVTLHIEELQITGEQFSNVLRCFPVLSELSIKKCESLELMSMEDGGLGDLTRLQSFKAYNCNKLFSRWPMGEVGGGAHAIKPFPDSLTELDIWFEDSMQSMGLLSNLTSLTSLSLRGCSNLKMHGFNPLITGNLWKFSIGTIYDENTIWKAAVDLLGEIQRSTMYAGSFQLEVLNVCSFSTVLRAPICSHLATTLHTLMFSHADGIIFTEEQERALHLLSSLRHLEFDSCHNLKSLPQGLHRLLSLKKLRIEWCRDIRSLPSKEGLPTSLETLEVYECGRKATKQAQKLRAADPWFSVKVEGLDAVTTTILYGVAVSTAN